jgi:TolB-like protein/class 3 adenylate cyclase
MSAPRKLAAILAADVAGYSRLIGIDEEGTLKRLRKLRRELINPAVSLHRGRIVKTTGDGILIEFPSVVDAVRCALEVQRGMDGRNIDVPGDRRLELRVGINLGDVVVEGEDLLGDGVNVAARLEGISEPGGICISDNAYRHIQDKALAQFIDIGERQLKNIARPVRAYKVSVDAPTSGKETKPALALPDKPSIAVLPFQNMSGDPEQEYFADGIVEEIITALSRFHNLFVIARNSSFTYKGQPVDVKQVGRELGVRYVLEGSVRKVGNRVRITGQLIDATTAAHIWAGRFEGAFEDIFELQDKMTASVVGAIAPTLEQAEIERIKRKPTESLDAYDCFLRGASKIYQWTREANDEALQFFYRAIELDPDFASAYGYATWCYAFRKNSGWVVDPEQEVVETARLARRAIELGKDDAFALCWAGYAIALVVGNLDDGIAFLDRALELNPNLARAWNLSGWARIWLGQPEIAIEHLERGKRLSPLDPAAHVAQTAAAHAHFYAGRYDEAYLWAGMALREQPDFQAALRIAAASAALAGRAEEARKACTRWRQLNPMLRVSNFRRTLGPYRRSEDLARQEEGLRKAGLPE